MYNRNNVGQWPESSSLKTYYSQAVSDAVVMPAYKLRSIINSMDRLMHETSYAWWLVATAGLPSFLFMIMVVLLHTAFTLSLVALVPPTRSMRGQVIYTIFCVHCIFSSVKLMSYEHFIKLRTQDVTRN